MEEILSSPGDTQTKEITEAAQRWKRKFYSGWRDLPPREKILRLKGLLFMLALASHMDVNDTPRIIDSNFYAWNGQNKNLFFDTDHPSILSALHEFGHCLYGNSELKACRFSVWLFKTVFPQSFKKLKPHGHMLKL